MMDRVRVEGDSVGESLRIVGAVWMAMGYYSNSGDFEGLAGEL